MDLSEEKQRVRRALLARRRAVTPAAAERAAAAVAAHLLAEPLLRAARRVALYAASAGELPTRPLFEALAALPAARLLPRIVPGGGLEFARVERWEDLRPGCHGILAPPDGAPPGEPAAGDVVLLPGVAFDAAGHRLGRGGGFYDRRFATAPPGAPILIGVAYALQVLSAVPHGPDDRAVDALATEEGVRWIERDAGER